MTGPLDQASNETMTTFDTVTFDDTPQVAASAHTSCIYFVVHNTDSADTVGITVGGSGDVFLLAPAKEIILHGDPSRYSFYNTSDSSSVALVYTIHHYV